MGLGKNGIAIALTLAFFGLILSSEKAAFAIEVDALVPSDQAKSITLDQDYLKKLQYPNNEIDVATAKLLKIQGPLTAAKLQAWLDQRVALVVSDQMNLEKSILMVPGVATYPEADRFPKTDQPKVKPESAPGGGSGAGSGESVSKPVMVMANVGAGIYTFAKQNKILVGLRKSDGSTLPIVSPHHGFIQIGSGLFLERLRVTPDRQDAPGNSLSRLATLFHESRHSDGHGETLAFPHAICPEGHPYAGYPACDRNLNGPYTVGAQILKTLSQSCGDCSTRDQAIFKIIIADSFSRILKTYPSEGGKTETARVWSDSFEKIKSFVPSKRLAGDHE